MTTSDLVLVGVVILLLLWEAYTLWITRQNRTDHITFRVRRAAAKYPIIIFLSGLLCGHFFWQ